MIELKFNEARAFFSVDGQLAARRAQHIHEVDGYIKIQVDSLATWQQLRKRAG